MDETLAEKIRKENIRIHKLEAIYYNHIHREIFNRYEQRRIKRDVNLIVRSIKNVNPLILDVGCGTGNISLKFLEHGLKVVGVDISKEMLGIFRWKIENNIDRIKLYCCDIDEFLKNDWRTYDVVTLCSILHHLPDYFSTLKDICSRVKNNGIIYIAHEPTLIRNMSHKFIHKILNRIDSLLHTVTLRLTVPDAPRSLNYNYADFHLKRGVNQTKVKDILTQSGFEVLHYEEYGYGLNWVSAIINNYARSSDILFTLISRKVSDNRGLRNNIILKLRANSR